MKIHYSHGSLCIIFRPPNDQREALGFKIKLKSERLYSERNGLRRGFCFGPLWFGTYAKPKER